MTTLMFVPPIERPNLARRSTGGGDYRAPRLPFELGRLVCAALPPRPDRGTLNEAIPLFYLGRSRAGFWVVREEANRSGGLFFFKSSALRFAARWSGSAGFATMLVTEDLEIERIPNSGNPLVSKLIAVSCSLRERARMLGSRMAGLQRKLRKTVKLISSALAQARLHSAAAAAERLRQSCNVDSAAKQRFSDHTPR